MTDVRALSPERLIRLVWGWPRPQLFGTQPRGFQWVARVANYCLGPYSSKGGS